MDYYAWLEIVEDGLQNWRLLLGLGCQFIPRCFQGLIGLQPGSVFPFIPVILSVVYFAWKTVGLLRKDGIRGFNRFFPEIQTGGLGLINRFRAGFWSADLGHSGSGFSIVRAMPSTDLL